MDDPRRIDGLAATIAIDDLDTDQIMPKQFLRGIDKAGLDRGLLWDLRFDGEGRPRPEFVLNRPLYRETSVLIGGMNFGCGSSREHAVWGLRQFGIRAVIAPSFGEIFYSNAMNNRLLAVMLAPDDAASLADEAAAVDGPLPVSIDLETLQVRTAGAVRPFSLSDRHRRMFVDGLDLIGASLLQQAAIDAFAARHAAAMPWLVDIASRTRLRLDEGG